MKFNSIPVTPEEKRELVNQIQGRRSLLAGKLSSRKSIHIVELQGELVQAEYKSLFVSQSRSVSVVISSKKMVSSVYCSKMITIAFVW